MAPAAANDNDNDNDMDDADSAESSRKQIDSVFEQFLRPERLERLEGILARRTRSLTVVLDHVRNPHNVSAVLRSADAFGLVELHLVGTEFEHSAAVSQGSERWMHLVTHDTPERAAQALRARGYAVAILCPEDAAAAGGAPVIPATELPFESPLALVFGNEHKGVSPVFQTAADYRAYIPMYGFAESLNVSVACAICLFLSTVAKTAPARRTPPLAEEERAELRSEWLQRGVPRAATILREITARRSRRER